MITALTSAQMGINTSTPDGAKSKMFKFFKITNWVKLKNKQHNSKVLLNSFPINGHTLAFCLRILCITQGFTLGVKIIQFPRFLSHPFLSIESKVTKPCVTQDVWESKG